AATVAEGSIPDTLGDAAVAVLNAIVLIEGGHRAQRFVVQALLPQRFLEILLEIVQRLELIRSSRDPHTTGSAEELLEAAVHQHTDLADHQHTGTIVDSHDSVIVKNIRRDIAAAHANLTALLRHGESGALQCVQLLLKRRRLVALSAKEHMSHYM